MGQAPESQSGVLDPSFGGSDRGFEPTISCVLPWQGSAAALRHHVLPLLDDVSALVRLWELIVVDDGCADSDAAAMATWAQVEGIRVVRLARRFGRDAAIAAGLQLAHGDVVVVLQGKDPRASELIAGLLAKWRQGFQVVHSSEPCTDDAESTASRRAQRLRASSGSGFTKNDLARARNGYRALLIDRSALQDFASPQARASRPSPGQPKRLLRVVAVPTPPLLAGEPFADRSSSRFGTAAKRAIGVLREAIRSLGGWRLPSSFGPVVEVRGELGIGLAPRTSSPASQSSGFSGPAEPHV